LVEPRGPACHTGARTCFHRQLAGSAAAEPAASDKPGNNGAPADGEAEAVDDGGGGDVANETRAGGADIGAVVAKLFAVVEGRRREMPENSYTTYLFGQGLNKILKKVGEESAETIIAAKDGDRGALTAELSDLVYHLVVLMVERGVTLEALAGELARRGRGEGG
jgi:phosphoribosyl-ATP pyrophosphohydrolase/phosphoribosyl-AMP cyclohydrolase